MSPDGASVGKPYIRASDGRAVCVLNLPPDGTGGRRRIAFYGKTKKEARNKALEAHAKHIARQPVQADRTPLGVWLDRWLTEVVAPHRSAGTLAARATQVARITERLGAVPLGRLTRQHVQQLVNDLRQQYRPNTVHGTHGALVAALGEAVRRRMIPDNPASGVYLPERPRAEPRVLTPAEARRFVAQCAGEHYGPLLVTALSLGLRLGEARGLRWEDVDLAAGTVTICQQVQRRTGQGFVSEPPKDKEPRVLPLPAFLVEALRRQQTRVKVLRLAAGADWQERGLVFPTTRGTVVEDRILQHALSRVLTAARLPRLTPHKLRHSCATILIAQGVDLKTCATLLGHADLTMLSKVYAQSLPESQAAAAKAMHLILGDG